MIDGSTCNATDNSGCSQTPATVDVGGNPVELAVDEATHTVYVPVQLGDVFGFVAMIDTATCNGSDTSGCSQPPPTAPVGTQPAHVAVNPATHTVYVSNEEDSTVSVIDDATCNATNSSGCSTPLPAMAIPYGGGSVEVDVATDTVYCLEPGLQQRLGAQRSSLQREPHLRLHLGSRQRRRSAFSRRASR